jgi:hypothetical protein
MNLYPFKGKSNANMIFLQYLKTKMLDCKYLFRNELHNIGKAKIKGLQVILMFEFKKL